MVPGEAIYSRHFRGLNKNATITGKVQSMLISVSSFVGQRAPSDDSRWSGV